MADMMNDPAMPPPEGDPAMQEPQAEQVPDQPAGDQQASPEEQAAYEQFVAHGLLLVYSNPKMFGQVVKMLEGGGEPQEGLARATALVVARVLSAAEKAQQQIPGDVVFHAGKEIFEDLAELSGRAGIKDYGEDQDWLEGALLKAADQLRTMLQESGKIDQQAAASDMERLQQMDQSGELQKMFEDLAAKDDEGGAEQMSEDMPPPEDQPRGLAMGMN